MSQVSPPIRILLVGSIVFLAAWFVLLRPKAEEPVAPAAAVPVTAQPSTPVTQPVTSNGSAAQPSGATAPAKAKVSTAGLPASVAKAVASRKVLVMLFWNRNALDDRAVRRELRGIDRHKGKVKVHVASIAGVERYSPITRGVNLNQSPTVVIVDRNRRADALVGYVDRGTIDQAVSDALRAR